MNNIEQFLIEYEQLCIKYNLSLSHVDYHGDFIIENYDKRNIEWVKNAEIEIK